MREIKCPQCGCAIAVDESDYAAILNQVRNEEFNSELARREADMKRVFESDEARRISESKAQHEKALSLKDAEISRLNDLVSSLKEKGKLEIDNAVAGKESIIANLRTRIDGLEKEKEMAVKMAKIEQQGVADKQLRAKDDDILPRAMKSFA